MGEVFRTVDAQPENPLPSPWPLFTIDFDASSLEPRSYPIEVGIYRRRSPGHPIEGWSTLIGPQDEPRRQVVA